MKYLVPFFLLLNVALADEPFLMPVADVFPISGMGTVVSGQVVRGKLVVGDQVQVVGLGQDRDATVARVMVEPSNMSVVLRGVTPNEVTRGQMLALADSVRARSDFEAELSEPVQLPGRPILKMYTAQVTAQVEQTGTHLKIHLQEPLVAEAGWKFTLWNSGKQVAEGSVQE